MIKENTSDKIIETAYDPNTEANLNSIYLFDESSLGISQLKVSIENKIVEEITKEEHLDLTKEPLTTDLSEAQLEKEF